MTFSFYLNKNYEIDYFHTNANDDKKIDFVDDDELLQIDCLHRCKIINDFIKTLVDNDENKVIDMFLYFKQHFRSFDEIFHYNHVISKCYFQ